MKTIRTRASICGTIAIALAFLAITANDSHAVVLCKPGFDCPIIENMSSDGDGYSYGGGAGDEGAWEVSGPWGAGGASITVSGNSRCSSDTREYSYGEIGNPAPGGGENCWCQMINGSYAGAWVFLGNEVGSSNCANNCADSCKSFVQTDSGFRNAICVPPPVFVCPIVGNMSSNKDDNGYIYGDGSGQESTWMMDGPWGDGGALITISGRSRCSSTDGNSLGEIGNPVTGGGVNCWCQIVNNAASGAWVFLFGGGFIQDCVSFCASNCAGGVGDDPGVRAAVCVPHIEPCGDVSIPADDICPPGYTQCTGTTTGDDTVGQYTMTCSM